MKESVDAQIGFMGVLQKNRRPAMNDEPIRRAGGESTQMRRELVEISQIQEHSRFNERYNNSPYTSAVDEVIEEMAARAGGVVAGGEAVVWLVADDACALCLATSSGTQGQ